MLRTLVSLLLLAFALSACASDPSAVLAAGGCRLVRRAELPLRSSRNFLLAPVTLNGHAALLVVDTGAEATTLTPQAAVALRLPRDPDHSSVLLGVSGEVRSRNVRLRRFAIGDVVRRDESLVVGAMPSFPGLRPPVAGLLGTDVLAQYDVDLDLPDGRMALYSVNGCAGGYTPWQGAVALPLSRTGSGLSFVDAVVDGIKVQAMLDTGARTTLLARRTALAIGLSDSAVTADPERRVLGIGMRGIGFTEHRFAELGLPGALVRDVSATIAELRLPGVQMLLGADYLGKRRVWIAYSSGRLFLR